MSLRVRLVLAAAAAIVAAIAALGAAALLFANHELRAGVDATLRGRALDVAKLSASAPALLTTPGALDAPLGGRLTAVEVLDGEGRIVARSASLAGEVLPAGALAARAIRSGRTGIVSTRLGGEPIRVYAAPLADTGGPASGGAVLVGSSTREIEDTLGRLRTVIALSALGAALLGALAAALLTGRGLSPLRRLSAAAGAIATTGDAGRRLPEPATHDEVAELATTLNSMLAALERARERERRFLADASHELRTPLTSLRGNAAYVAAHGADQAAIADIEADAARLGRLLDDLLTLEREDAAPKHPHALIRLDELATEVARGDPRIDLALGPATVAGDRYALERALRNLLENARIHGPADGRIRVSVERRGDRAELSVEDDGPGIAPEDVEQALSRFWRGGSGDRPGSGLGLAIVAAIAERHGGRVTVDRSRFTITLKDLSRSAASLDGVPLEERT